MKADFTGGSIRIYGGSIQLNELHFGAVYSVGQDKELIHASFEAMEVEAGLGLSGNDGSIAVTLSVSAVDGGMLAVCAQARNVSGRELKLWTINLLEGEGPDGQVISLGGSVSDYRFYTYNDEFVSRIDKLDGAKPSFNRYFMDTWAGMDVFWQRPEDLVYDREGWCISRDFGGVFNAQTQLGLFAGFTGPGNAFGDVCLKKQDGQDGFYLRSRMDGVLLEPGEARQSETALLMEASAVCAAEIWAAAAARAMGGARKSRPLSGWCSWYQFGHSISEDTVNKAVGEYAQLDTKVDVLQIDDGFDERWGDWRPNARFPSGMKRVADRIRQAGFIPGVYLVPTGVHIDSAVYKAHPDWLQRLPDGSLAVTFSKGSLAYLDPTHPEVAAFIAETARMQTADWGFDYIKYDFTYPLAFGAVFHDKKMTTFQMHREIYRILREAVGEDKYLMACVGEPARYAIGYADAARIGPDSAVNWHRGMREALQCVVLRMNVDGLWFHSDPDVFFLRSERCELNREERLFTAAVMAMAGSLVMTSDLPSQWDEEAKQVFAAATAMKGVRARPLSLPGGEMPEVLAASVEGGVTAALLNWGEEEKSIQLDMAMLGLDPAGEYAVHEVWTGSSLGHCASSFIGPVQPPHSARVFTFSERQ